MADPDIQPLPEADENTEASTVSDTTNANEADVDENSEGNNNLSPTDGGSESTQTDITNGGSTGTDAGGSTPPTYDRSGVFNVHRGMRWTLSKQDEIPEIPYIKLKEHRLNQNQLDRQSLLYTQGLEGAVNSATNGQSGGVLNVYEEIWPDQPTGNDYIFPYFSDISFNLETPPWNNVDDITNSLAAAGDSAVGALSKTNSQIGKRLTQGYDIATTVASVGLAAGALGLKAAYPVVGIPDRPRIFGQHNARTISVSFPLYNTYNENDWKKHYNFIFVFASQNLFLKRNFITGAPPVFYRVHVPGIYFSFASCVTQFRVTNLGNVRTQNTGTVDTIVPDAYQVDITLMEMLMPSLNQQQALLNGEAAGKVTVQN